MDESELASIEAADYEFDVRLVPLPPTPTTVPSVPLDVSHRQPPPHYTREEMADKVMAAAGPGDWSPSLRASLATLRHDNPSNRRRQRYRLTNAHGQSVRLFLPSSLPEQSFPE